MEQLLSTKQYLAIASLAAGSTNKEAADRAGVSESSVEKWRRRPDFQNLLRRAVAHIHDAAVAELSLGAIEAARELRRIINSPDSSDRVKIAAIQTLFTQLQNARNWDNEVRLERLEELLDAREEDSTTRKALFGTTVSNGSHS